MREGRNQRENESGELRQQRKIERKKIKPPKGSRAGRILVNVALPLGTPRTRVWWGNTGGWFLEQQWDRGQERLSRASLPAGKHTRLRRM